MELATNHETTVKGQSPSMVYNNMCAAKNTYAYAHQHDVILLRPLGPSKLPLRDADKAPVTHVTALPFRGGVVVAVTTNTHTQLWDIGREAVIAAIFHGDASESRGCQVLDFGDKLFCAIGHGSGEVTFAEIGHDFSVNVFAKHKAHRSSVTAVHGSQNSPTLFSTGSTDGELQLWNSAFSPFVKVPAPGDCVTSICTLLTTSLIAVGYGSGAIRVFQPDSGAIRTEIGAHSKWITALSYCPARNVFASCGEDGNVLVWQAPTPASGEIVPVGQRHFDNLLLTGVCFSEDGRVLTVAAFDSEKVTSLILP